MSDNSESHNTDDATPHRILAIATDADAFRCVLERLSADEVVFASGPIQALQLLFESSFDAMFVEQEQIGRVLEFSRLARANSVIDMLPIGVALVDPTSLCTTWHNRRFREWCATTAITSVPFFDALGGHEIVGKHDPSPFHSVRLRRQRVTTLLKTNTKQFLAMEVLPILDSQQVLKHYLVILEDRTDSTIASQKLQSLQDAGRDLGNLSTRDICLLSEDERIDLLKAKIIAYTEDILHYDKIEVRLLSHDSDGRLDPLLAVGLHEEAMQRVLYALPEGNGITGFVAYHAKSVLVEDTDSDPRFLIGALGAKSSMTIPLVSSRDQVIGTFNVESVERGAFTQTDLEFLESFGHDVASAIHTLELLSVEQSDATLKSVEAIHRNVARPISAILNHAARLIPMTVDAKSSDLVREMPANRDEQISEGLHAIQDLAREIMTLIQKVGQRMTPSFAAPVAPATKNPFLFKRRILVVDDDESVGIAVNSILFHYGCLVEFAPSVEQAVRLASQTRYDVFLSDIRPGEQSGYDLLIELQHVLAWPYIPLILMKGYGYDAGHVTVKAKQAGVLGFLAKPFILDQMITNIEKVVTESQRLNGDHWPIAKEDDDGRETRG
ncbi:MAG: response regulator [Thermoguttaceae bacterium]